ncbi:MAG: PSD1 and planctomycete cytochrome C domain-containing protein [Aureliella sp.]
MHTCMALLAILLLTVFPTRGSADEEIDFNREIRPILANNCFPCHGPDEASREADLRLDLPSEAAYVFEAASPEDSDFWARITSKDEDLLMPPPDSGKALTAEQKELIHDWIGQGYKYASHWAFTPPTKPNVPEVSISGKRWSRNDIDFFVSRKHEQQDVVPSPRAEVYQLIRRLSLDLTGLPPTPELVDHWSSELESNFDRGYSDLCEELLRSPHFGERWARLWLDAARYADSDGYEKDKPRNVWFYRDWVIHSFNEDRPYDDFIIRQIAGDLLPNPTQSDIVATGFLRNSMVNEEGGADPEQFRMEAMFDRMDAVGKAVLGLTIQCAQCHTHKYDPLQHRDYYRMFACLNNTHDVISTVYNDSEQELRRASLAKIAEARSGIRKAIPDWRSRLSRWIESQSERKLSTWQTPEFEFSDTSLSGSKFLRQPNGSYLCQSYAPTSFRPEMTGRFDGPKLSGMQLDLLPHPNLPRSGPGRSVDGTWAISEVYVDAALSGSPDKKQRLKIKRAAADRSPPRAELKPRYDNKKNEKRITGGIEFAVDGDEKTAWTNEVDSPLSNTANRAWFVFEEPFEIPDDQHALVTVSLAQRHGGWNSDDNQTFAVGCFRVSFTADSVPIGDPLPPAINTILAKASDERSVSDQTTLFDFWCSTLEEVSSWNEKIKSAWDEHPLGTTQLTLSELTSPRETWLLDRGDFLSRLERVQPGTPDFLHAWPDDGEPARLQFARWLVSDASPTTARSIVNRIWQAYFGIGLVETSDDLGTQSTPPSHPELLDFLATELMEHNWSLKHIHRLIISSATYQQSSQVSPELAELDPYNRLLARGARFRVPAETVRDIALASSGLLDPTIGGRSVFPPAPAFLFTPPVSYGPKTWDEERDSQRYRRALYTFRFRSVLYPMLENFDAVACNVACVKRSTSNTPMQALTAMNEPLFQECAAALAANVSETLPSASDVERIDLIYKRCLSRGAKPEEQRVLLDYLATQRERLDAGDLQAALILGGQTSSSPEGSDFATAKSYELASWTLLCRVVLNLDESITRE